MVKRKTVVCCGFQCLGYKCHTNFEAERYKHAVDLFLAVYPNGHKYPQSRKLKKPNEHVSVTSILSQLVPDSDDNETEYAQVPGSVDDLALENISSDSESDSESSSS